MDARLQRLFLQPECRHMTAPELAVAIRRESITVTPYTPLEWVTVCPSPHRAFSRAGLARIRRSRRELRKLPTGRSRHGCALRVSLDFAYGWVWLRHSSGLACVVGFSTKVTYWIVPCRRVGRGFPGPCFRGRWGWWVGGQGKAARMRCQAVAIAAAHRQVASMRSRVWRAPRVMRAAVCSTR